MKLNINHNVKVKLTEKGLDILERQHKDWLVEIPGLGDFTPPEVDENGFSTFQLWVLMEKLGKHFRMGSDLPFEAEIEILEK